MFNDKTKNQHYISQVEQKLNCINSDVLKKNRRIYEFEILNHLRQEFKLTNSEGVKITNNLSFDDLYSLEVFKDGTRDNFEKFFSKLESQIENLSDKILNSSEIDKEILSNFFCAKLMNSIRNPFCIDQTINNFGIFCDYYPTETDLLKVFQKIDLLDVNPKILSTFNTNSISYKKWIKIIFYMVVPFKGPQTENYSFLKKFVANFLDNKKGIISIVLSVYDAPSCLLSDRSYLSLYENENIIDYTFNITKNAFITFTHIPKDINSMGGFLDLPSEELESDLLKEVIEKFIIPIKIKKFTNEKALLATYNRNVIAQSYQNFYSSFLHNKQP